METVTATLVEERSAHRWLCDVWERCIKPHIRAGGTVEAEFFDEKTRAQERLLHSCYRDMAAQCLLADRQMEAGIWKESLKYAFYLATKDDPDYREDWKRRKPRMVPMIDGDGFIMSPINSKGFTKRLYSAFIAFVHATGDARGVRWSVTSLGREAVAA